MFPDTVKKINTPTPEMYDTIEDTQVSSRERIRIVGCIDAGLAGQTEGNAAEEHQVNTDEGDPEVDASNRLIVHESRSSRETSQLPAGKWRNAPSDSTCGMATTI